jgi:hypothetical protein
LAVDELDERQQERGMEAIKIDIASSGTIGLDLDIVVLCLSRPHHEIDSMIVNFGGEHITAEQNELHLGKILRILAELKAIKVLPAITLSVWLGHL